MKGCANVRIEVLVSTMHQTDHHLIEKMNIQSDAIIINQCDRNKFEEFEYKGCSIRFLSFAERGIGLSRNNALMRATADIILFADDDVVYVKNYNQIIIEAFKNNPKADMIVFNVPSSNPDRPEYTIREDIRVKWFNCLRYGTFRIAVRVDKLKSKNIYFSLLFGGGARYSAGEDSLFISEFIKSGLKIYANPAVIGHVSHEDSTWFKGFTDKYFIDKGVFFYRLSKGWAKLLCLQFAIRHYRMYQNEKTIRESLKLMIKGTREKRSAEITKPQ